MYFISSVQDFVLRPLSSSIPASFSCLLKEGEKLLGKYEAGSFCSGGSLLPSSPGMPGCQLSGAGLQQHSLPKMPSVTDEKERELWGGKTHLLNSW